jgi:hypothetical protein
MPSKNKLKMLKTNAALQQEWRCFYCQLPMWEDNLGEFIVRYGISPGLAKRFQCTAEHVEARCDGGKDIAKNIVAACLFCNATRHKAKHPLDATKHLTVVRRRLAKGRWHPPQVMATLGKRRMPPL